MSSSLGQKSADKTQQSLLCDSDVSSDLESRDDEGCEDLDDEVREDPISCLFNDATVPNIQGLVQHCKTHHDWDLPRIFSDLGMHVFHIRL